MAMKQSAHEFVHGLNCEQASERITELESLVRDMYEYLGSYGAAMDSFGYRNGPRVRAEFGERMAALGLPRGKVDA